MKIKNRQKNLKKISLGVITFVVLAGAYGSLAFFNQWWPFVEDIHREPINYNPPTSEQQKAGEQASEEAKKDDEISNQTTPSNESNATTVTITSLNQNNSILQVRTFIHTIDPGICTATLTRDAHTPIEKTAETQALANGSTCRGFDIPTGDIAKGEWILTIKYKSSNNTQGSIEENVTIE